MTLPDQAELRVDRLGEARHPSPLESEAHSFTSDEEGVLASTITSEIAPWVGKGEMPPAFEPAGPRRELFFDPAKVSCGIVTCGGICPGVNDVIRSIVLTATHWYGVDRILGYRYGYEGLTSHRRVDPMELDPERVSTIHAAGGTILGSSRGPQDVGEMVDTLERDGVSMLFTIGGDGTAHGAAAIAEEVARRKRPVAIVGIPKTIDNDIQWVQRSFGFLTAVQEARGAIVAAHTEATGAWNGVGIVKLMGRHSGFIAAYATLAVSDVNFCLVPEVPFALRGEGGLLPALEERLAARHHAVIVVAEGAGQELLATGGRDASGNRTLGDIGTFLRDEIVQHFGKAETPVTVKYIDPSYMIRSLPANARDSAYCLVLGQHAVHAAMAGRTNLIVGYWNNRFTHAPIPLVVGARKQLDPRRGEWQRVLQATGQPAMTGRAAAPRDEVARPPHRSPR